MKPERYRQVKEVFAAAAGRGPDSRDDFLATACAGDAGLRAEVESLLEHDEAAREFIEESAFDVAVRLMADGDARSLEGRRVGPYRILREVGRGGMGVVYEAARADGKFDQRVAVKVVKRGLDTEDILRRFRHERQILASLDHPNIARLFDGGENDEGLPYFVMEYVEGVPLLRYCDEHDLSIEERLKLFRTVCLAVQHAHQNLVVHRDLKPSNILVTSGGEPKLLDFGVAKLLEPGRDGAGMTETQWGRRALTPEYASPEQVSGSHVTTTSDVYSLGVVLYELLTGARPYGLGDNASAVEISSAVCGSEPLKPSQAIAVCGFKDRFFKSANRKPQLLTGDLDNIVLKALRKDPARRYKSVEQFSEDIKRYLTGLPVMARKDTLGYRTAKFIGRHRAGVAAAALIALAVIAGFVGTAWQARVAARERDQARQEKARGEELNKFLQEILSAASPEEKGKDAKVIDVLNEAAQRLETKFVGQPPLKAQALQTIGETYINLGLFVEAERALREALNLNQQLYDEESKEVSASLLYLSQITINKGQYAESEQLLRRAVEIEHKLSPAGSKELALALFTRGELHVRKGEYAQALPLLQESVLISDKLFGARNEDSAYTLTSLGRAKEYSGDAAGAEAIYRQSLAIFRQLPRRYESRMGILLLNLGHLLATKGNYEEAISMMREAESIFHQQGDATAYSYFSKSFLVRAYTGKGDYDKATEEADKAIEIARKQGLDKSPDFFFTLINLGLSLTRTGKAREGEPYLRESLAQTKEILPANDSGWLLTESALGECLTAQSRFAEAEPLILHSYENLKAILGETHAATAQAAKRAVELYDKWRKPERASIYRAAISGATQVSARSAKRPISPTATSVERREASEATINARTHGFRRCQLAPLGRRLR